MPPPPQPWFIAHLAIGPVALPWGITVEAVPITPPYDAGEYLEITNISETLLYLSAIKPPYTTPNAPFEASPIQLSSGRIPAFRAASGEAYVWDIVTDDAPWEWGWRPFNRYRPSDPIRLRIGGNGLRGDANARTYYLAEFEWRNKYDYGGRPDDVQVPSPHDTTLPMDYATEEIILPLTISYTLNEHYPKPKDFGLSWIIVPAILLAALICLVWLRRKSKIRNLQSLIPNPQSLFSNAGGTHARQGTLGTDTGRVERIRRRLFPRPRRRRL